MKFLVPAVLVFAGLTTVALAGAPPAETAPGCACKPVVVVEAPSCTGAKKSCAGEASSAGSCSGRTTFAQRRAARQTARQEARAARACARAQAACGDCCESACDCCPEQEVRVVSRSCPTCN